MNVLNILKKKLSTTSATHQTLKVDYNRTVCEWHNDSETSQSCTPLGLSKSVHSTQVSTTERLSLLFWILQWNTDLWMCTVLWVKQSHLLHHFYPSFVHYFILKKEQKYKKKRTMRKVVCNRTLLNRFWFKINQCRLIAIPDHT